MKFADLFFEYLGIALLFVNACLFLRSYNSNKKIMAFTFFTWYLLLVFIVLFTSFILALYKINNLYLSHFYFIIQFIVLSLFYKALLTKRQCKGINMVLISVLVILGIQYVLTPALFYSFNTPEVFLTSFPLVVYSIIHLYNALGKPGKFMYINAGILLYS